MLDINFKLPESLSPFIFPSIHVTANGSSELRQPQVSSLYGTILWHLFKCPCQRRLWDLILDLYAIFYLFYGYQIQVKWAINIKDKISIFLWLYQSSEDDLIFNLQNKDQYCMDSFVSYRSVIQSSHKTDTMIYSDETTNDVSNLARELVKPHVSLRICMQDMSSDFKFSVKLFKCTSSDQAKSGPSRFCAVYPQKEKIRRKKTCTLCQQLRDTEHVTFICYSCYERHARPDPMEKWIFCRFIIFNLMRIFFFEIAKNKARKLEDWLFKSKAAFALLSFNKNTIFILNKYCFIHIYQFLITNYYN